MKHVWLSIGLVLAFTTIDQPAAHAAGRSKSKLRSAYLKSSQVESKQDSQKQSSTSREQNSNPRTASVAKSGPVARIINGELTDAFPSVGTFVVGNILCTGVLVAPDWVLTAAHCAAMAEQPGDIQFEVGGVEYTACAVVIHENFDPQDLFAGHDLALIRLTESVPDVEPSPIQTSEPFVGQVLTIVGFGEDGDGENGGDPNTVGEKRAGITAIDEVADLLVWWTFDNDEEANTCFGDSGGPHFNEELAIVSITSGGTNRNCQIGDEAFNTRLDVFFDWMQIVMDETAECDPADPMDPMDPQDPQDPQQPEEDPEDADDCPCQTLCDMIDDCLEAPLPEVPPLVKTLPGTDGTLDRIRAFRDRVLARSDDGRRLIGLYYRHGNELSRILLTNPRLAVRTFELLADVLPSLDSAVRSGGVLALEEKHWRRSWELAAELEKHAGRRLADDLRTTRRLLSRREQADGELVVLNFAGATHPEWNGPSLPVAAGRNRGGYAPHLAALFATVMLGTLIVTRRRKT